MYINIYTSLIKSLNVITEHTNGYTHDMHCAFDHYWWIKLNLDCIK